MKVPARQLEQHLRRDLARCYLVAGAEPLLVSEALEAVRAAARTQGFEERELHVVERGFDWNQLTAGMDNMSLFSARRIVEVRMHSARPGDVGSKAIRALSENDDPDTLVLIGIFAKLESTVARSAWVKSIEKAGAVVDVWPLALREMPGWIQGRAKAAGIRFDSDAAEILAERVEGNLLAADQEIRKLAMTAAGASISAKTVLDAVASSARFDIFSLSDALMQGDAARAMQILETLRGEGVAPALVAWAVNRDIGLLSKVGFAMSRGESVDSAIAKSGVWRRQQPIVKSALRRLRWPHLRALMARAADVDAVIKGAAAGQPWDALTQLVTAVIDPTRLRAPAPRW